MPVGIGKIILYLPLSHSLKEKRHMLSPILSRLKREFNISIVEYGMLDNWQQSELGIAIISNDIAQVENSFRIVVGFIQSHWPDVQIPSEHLDIIH